MLEIVNGPENVLLAHRRSNIPSTKKPKQQQKPKMLLFFGALLSKLI